MTGTCCAQPQDETERIPPRGLPQAIVVDNGSVLISKALDVWIYRNGVRLHFIKLDQPVQNAFVESFTNQLRDKRLNELWSTSLFDAGRTIVNAGPKKRPINVKSAPSARTSSISSPDIIPPSAIMVSFSPAIWRQAFKSSADAGARSGYGPP